MSPVLPGDHLGMGVHSQACGEGIMWASSQTKFAGLTQDILLKMFILTHPSFAWSGLRELRDIIPQIK